MPGGYLHLLPPHKGNLCSKCSCTVFPNPMFAGPTWGLGTCHGGITCTHKLVNATDQAPHTLPPRVTC